jgi:hypothetical protein
MKVFTRHRSFKPPGEPPDTWHGLADTPGVTGVKRATDKSDNGYLTGTGK